MTKPFLKGAIPALAEELRTLLVEEGEPELAEQVPQLQIVDRCRCGCTSCATIYTVLRPTNGWKEPHRNVMLSCCTGYLILDVVEGNIVCIEVLDRDDYRRKLDEVLPLAASSS